MKAYCLLRAEPYYRKETFVTGLLNAGFELSFHAPAHGRPGDVLLIWNRYGHWGMIASAFESEGGTVLVAENGYINKYGGNPKFDSYDGISSDHYYALALGGHNGSGRWYVGGRERLDALELNLKPWRTTGEHILICPNRDFGSSVMQPPLNWTTEIYDCLRKEFPNREIRVRPHPGNKRPGRDLKEDLKNCWECVIWASSSGIHALVEGIPVRCLAPYWIGKIKGPYDQWTDEKREQALIQMSWGQWSIEEIRSGAPIVRLLEIR